MSAFGQQFRERVNRLATYTPPGDEDSRSLSASGYRLFDLYDGGLLSAEHMRQLGEVADIVELDGTICENLRLLDAWLDAFEILASVHASDFGTDPTTQPMPAPAAHPGQGVTP